MTHRFCHTLAVTVVKDYAAPFIVNEDIKRKRPILSLLSWTMWPSPELTKFRRPFATLLALL